MSLEEIFKSRLVFSLISLSRECCIIILTFVIIMTKMFIFEQLSIAVGTQNESCYSEIISLFKN